MDEYQHQPLTDKLEEIDSLNIEIDLKKLHEAREL